MAEKRPLCIYSGNPEEIHTGDTVYGSGGGTITLPITFTMNGGGSVLTTGTKGWVVTPFAGTITGWTLLVNPSGTMQIDIWKDILANFMPTDSDSITASAPVYISSAYTAHDETLSGWTTSFSAGDVFAFNIDSCSTIQHAVLVLTVTQNVS